MTDKDAINSDKQCSPQQLYAEFEIDITSGTSCPLEGFADELSKSVLSQQLNAVESNIAVSRLTEMTEDAQRKTRPETPNRSSYSVTRMTSERNSSTKVLQAVPNRRSKRIPERLTRT